MLINGLDARTAYGFALDSPQGWLDTPERQTPAAQVLRRGGLRVLDTPRDQTRQIVLRGTIMGSSVGDARDKADALKLALCRNTGAQLTFEDEPTRYVCARCQTFRIPPYGPSMLQSRLSVEATMIAHDPYAYDIDPAGVLLWYQPGDTIAGETFARSTVGYSINAAGVLVSSAINVKRDNHYIGGVRSLLLEGAGKNCCVDSENMGAAGWITNGGVRTGGQTDPAGGTTAWLLTASGVAQGLDEVPVFTGNGEKCVSRFFHQGTLATILFGLYDQTAAVYRHQVRITWTAGVPVLTTTIGSGTRFAVEPLVGSWYRISISAVGVVAANSNRVLALSEAAGTYIMYGAQDEDNIFPTSYFKTVGGAASRGADQYALPYPLSPQEMSVYTKHVELGTSKLLAAARVFEIGTGGGVGPCLLCYNPSGAYTAYHDNGTGAVFIGAVGADALGDTVELNSRLFADGSVDETQSLNGGATTSGAQTAARPLAGAWSSPLFYINSAGATGKGFGAYQAIRVAAKVRTLAEMRTLQRVPLGTGPVRPVITITGASTNPVITLYNKAGIAVGSISLTITTIGGDTLVIDMDAKTIKKNGVNILSALTTGDFFSIDPLDQDNFGDPGPDIRTSSGAMSVSYKRAWR